MKTVQLLILTFAGLLFGCQHDKSDSYETRISGYYKIVSMESTVEVDMNNDGIRSDDLYSEISSPYHPNDDDPVSFYDFEASPNFMEVRPLHYQTNNAKLIALNIPDQRIEEVTAGDFFLSEYLHSFYAYRYELSEQSGKIELISHNTDFIENGTLHDFELQADGSLVLNITKDIFDFVDSKWVTTNLTITYHRVD